MRPRFPGYIPFQSEALPSSAPRSEQGSTATELYDALTDLQRAAMTAASARKARS